VNVGHRPNHVILYTCVYLFIIPHYIIFHMLEYIWISRIQATVRDYHLPTVKDCDLTTVEDYHIVTIEDYDIVAVEVYHLVTIA
jgi:hypothetical protein